MWKLCLLTKLNTRKICEITDFSHCVNTVINFFSMKVSINYVYLVIKTIQKRLMKNQKTDLRIHLTQIDVCVSVCVSVCVCVCVCMCVCV